MSEIWIILPEMFWIKLKPDYKLLNCAPKHAILKGSQKYSSCVYSYLHVYFGFVSREAKPHSHPKNLHELVPGFGGLLACKINCNGTKVSAAVKMVSITCGKICHNYFFSVP